MIITKKALPRLDKVIHRLLFIGIARLLLDRCASELVARWSAPLEDLDNMHGNGYA